MSRLDIVKRQPVSLAKEKFFEIDCLRHDKTLPLVIKAISNDIEVTDCLEDSQGLIKEKLNKHGAILLRGFNLDTPTAFEKACFLLCPDLFNKNGEHPRETISGNVYTPVFYPAEQKLLWHNENSFNHSWPKKIFFGCRQPAKQGGETPIVDSRKVFELINPKVRERFLEKKIMYIRNYDYGLGLDWQTVFNSENKAEVEAVCKKDFMDLEWKKNGGLRTRAVRPAIVKSSQTGEFTWFAQAQHWHISCMDVKTRKALLSSFSEEDLPRNCYYGDGSPIEDSVMSEICEVYQKLEVSFSWQSGDLLILDNLLTAHARNPYVGERKLLVAMGEMMNFDEV
ncbi:MAG: TauD/TfdA family dioxygenase [Hydrococcus sp. CRU_1_1]|nr:TauD/TfdA family dioxygenase [Hydrococcus sp. CRU_1_1]